MPLPMLFQFRLCLRRGLHIFGHWWTEPEIQFPSSSVSFSHFSAFASLCLRENLTEKTKKNEWKWALFDLYMQVSLLNSTGVPRDIEAKHEGSSLLCKSERICLSQQSSELAKSCSVSRKATVTEFLVLGWPFRMSQKLESEVRASSSWVMPIPESSITNFLSDLNWSFTILILQRFKLEVAWD